MVVAITRHCAAPARRTRSGPEWAATHASRPGTVWAVRRILVTALLACLALAVVPTAASAQSKLFQDFRKNGSINPCNYTNKELQQGLNGLPPDVQQYAPGFGDQLRGGRGNCGGGGGSGTGQQGTQQNDNQGGAAVPGGPGGGGGPTKPKPQLHIHTPPAPTTRRAALAGTATPKIDSKPSGSDAPGWLFVLLALAAAGGVLAFVARRRGWSAGERLRPLRAAFAEAGGRFSDSAATTRDRLRFR